MMTVTTSIFYIIVTFLSVEAIIVSVDRTDIVRHDPPSIILNGWRPLANYDNKYRDRDRKSTQFSTSSNNPHEASKKSERRPVIEFGPLSVLGSYNHMIGQSTIAKVDIEPKILSNDQGYTFELPTSKNGARFDFKSSKKQTPDQDIDTYLRSSQFSTQIVKPAEFSLGPTYYIKPANIAGNINPFGPLSKTYTFDLQQQKFQQASPLSRHATRGQDVSNDKPYHVINVGNSHYYNHINHPSSYKTLYNYERDPSYLVHESHEISYTPSSHKYRPFSAFKYVAQAPVSEPFTTIRPDTGKKFDAVTTKTLVMDKMPNPRANYVYVSDSQKTRIGSDINKVLPKTSQLTKFSSQNVSPLNPTQILYTRPESQQQYQSSIIPLSINQRQPEIEFETPESVSLKHYNEQQRLYQQQLIQHNRHRARDQEEHRHKAEIRQQHEEFINRHEEIVPFEQKKIKNLKQQLLETQKERSPTKHQVQSVSQITPPSNEYQKQVLQYHEQKPFSPPPQLISGRNFSSEKTPSKHSELQREISTTPRYQENQENVQSITRSYRLQKSTRRPEHSEINQKPIIRRKPTTVNDESPTILPTTIVTFEGFTDVPIQTTVVPENFITTTEKARFRKPSSNFRRRKPTYNFSSSEATSTDKGDNEYSTRYTETEEIEDSEKKKQARNNVHYNLESMNGNKKMMNGRLRVPKKPKVNHDYNDLELTTIHKIKMIDRPIEDILPTDNYPQAFLKSEFNPADYTSTVDTTVNQELSTEMLPPEFITMHAILPASSSSVSSSVDNSESTRDSRRPYGNSISLEKLFPKTESTTLESSISLVPVISDITQEPINVTKNKHFSGKTGLRLRPLRFSNTTRPRFSIKDYKSRMEYKSRLQQQQSSTTESMPTKITGKIDNSKGSKQMSRLLYRPNSTTSNSISNNHSQTVENNTTRFALKKIRSGSLRRPSATTNIGDKNSSTSRKLENIFSPSIRKPRPTFRSKAHKLQESSEIATAESGSLSPSSLSVSSGDFDILANISNKETNSSHVGLNATFPFDLKLEEELFAKASQSVADLTSSASALYDKPGMFKAVSPVQENRSISTHLRISTDEPTLPIEEFFQELSRKV